MPLLPTKIRRKGFTLLEMLVVCALMTAISAFTMVLYTTALGDFESANSKYTMNMYARKLSSKLEGILSTAAARRPLTTVPEAFYYPTMNDPAEYYYCDFITASNFIRTSTTECAYAFDDGTSATPGYTALFRYRIAWTNVPIGNIPANSVYMERLQLDPLVPTPISGTGAFRQVLSPNIGRCTFRRTVAGTIQVRTVIYAFDAATGRGIDGSINRNMTKRRRRDGTSTATRTDEKSFELLTSVPLPTLNIK